MDKDKINILKYAVKKYGSYAVLKMVIRTNNFEIAKGLLYCGAKVNLNLASTEAQVDTGAASPEDHKTLETNQRPVLSKEASETPLHLIAAKDDHYKTGEICELLLLKGANVNAINSDGETPLHVAAKSNRRCCELLLSKGANVNAINSDGETPLHVAAKNNSKCCEMLLRKGANVDVTDICGSTPLHYAARWKKMRREQPSDEILFGRVQRQNKVYRDHAETVPLIRYFMRPSVTANVNCANKIGETPLLIAAKEYNEEGVVSLLIAGANVNVSDQDGLTPLHYAAKWRQTTGVESLLRRSANINSVSKDGDTPLHFAAREGNLENVRIMLNYGANVNAENNRVERPLHVAIRKGNLTLFSFAGLRISPIKRSDKGRGHYCTSVADELLERGADINAQNLVGETALHVAIATSYEALTKWLVDKGCDVNTKTINNLTPLHYAARAGKLGIVEILVKTGANIDVSDENDLTPLDMAIRATESQKHQTAGLSIRSMVDSVRNGTYHEATAEFLFGLRPKVTAQNKVDVKLFHSVIERGWINLVRKMLSCSDVVAFINAASDEGFTSLHVAAKYSHRSIVQLLLSSGAVVNFSDNSGNTPLCYTSCVKIAKIFFEKEATGQICPDLFCNAVKENCIQFIEILLHKGADVNGKNKYGMTALHIACSSGNGDIVKLLLERGAEVDIRDSKNGFTALHFAASFRRNADVISTLLEGGADIDCGNIFPTVVEYGVDTDCKYGLTIDSGTGTPSLMHERSCASGKTALYVAVERSHDTNVRALLEYGADVNMKYGDCTPLTCAMEIKSGRIVRVLEEHIVWLKSMGSFVNESDLQATVLIGPVIQSLEINFEEELAELKKTKIGNSNASFHDFLTKGLDQLAILYGNENIKENLNAGVGCPASDFPFYGATISRRLKLAEERINLLKQTSTVLEEIFALPDLCIREITGYLRNRDLKSLIDAYCQ